MAHWNSKTANEWNNFFEFQSIEDTVKLLNPEYEGEIRNYLDFYRHQDRQDDVIMKPRVAVRQFVAPRDLVVSSGHGTQIAPQATVKTSSKRKFTKGVPQRITLKSTGEKRGRLQPYPTGFMEMSGASLGGGGKARRSRVSSDKHIPDPKDSDSVLENAVLELLAKDLVDVGYLKKDGDYYAPNAVKVELQENGHNDVSQSALPSMPSVAALNKKLHPISFNLMDDFAPPQNLKNISECLNPFVFSALSAKSCHTYNPVSFNTWEGTANYMRSIAPGSPFQQATLPDHTISDSANRLTPSHNFSFGARAIHPISLPTPETSGRIVNSPSSRISLHHPQVPAKFHNNENRSFPSFPNANVGQPLTNFDYTSNYSPAPTPIYSTSTNTTLLDAKPAAKRQRHVCRACVHCKKAHLACDEQRPCRRCSHLGKNDCADVEHKRRGRPKVHKA